jgi:hypothetical protein
MLLTRKRRLTAGLGLVVSFVMMTSIVSPAQASSKAASNAAIAQADCPPGVPCEVRLAALADGGYLWSPAHRPYDLPIYGINIHTTEGTLQQALDESQDLASHVSWNYLIDQTGKVWVQVPTDSESYDVGNVWVNSHYIEEEHIGFAGDCSSITPAEYNASVKLNRWLIRRFHIAASSSTIAGHDSYMSITDSSMPKRHWDPGVCWPWAKYLNDLGAPIVPTAGPNAGAVTIRTDDSHQPVTDCPTPTSGPSKDVPQFTVCQPANQSITNFVALYTAPSTSAPLLSDPYIHPDGSPGSTAQQDWGDKAPTGHTYVVLSRQPGWTQIQYSGGKAWFQDNGKVAVPTTTLTVTPKGNTAVPIYGRPVPEPSAPGWAKISYDVQTQHPLSKYVMQPGQHYAVASTLGVVPVPVRNDYYEGCNQADCQGDYDHDGVVDDRTVVIGNTKYIQIVWGHMFAFVKADDVKLGIA